MTSPPCIKRGDFFADSASLLLLDDLPVHDELLAGDELLTLSLNYRWREIIFPAIAFYFQQDGSDLSLDNEDLLNILLNDFYD